eukprot:gene10204-8118_t
MSGATASGGCSPLVSPNSGNSIVSLSAQQQQMWTIEQLSGASTSTYNVPIATHLSGSTELRADLLQKALDFIAFRHESLRTAGYHLDDDGNLVGRLLPSYAGLVPITIMTHPRECADIPCCKLTEEEEEVEEDISLVQHQVDNRFASTAMSHRAQGSSGRSIVAASDDKEAAIMLDGLQKSRGSSETGVQWVTPGLDVFGGVGGSVYSNEVAEVCEEQPDLSKKPTRVSDPGNSYLTTNEEADVEESNNRQPQQGRFYVSRFAPKPWASPDISRDPPRFPETAPGSRSSPETAPGSRPSPETEPEGRPPPLLPARSSRSCGGMGNPYKTSDFLLSSENIREKPCSGPLPSSRSNYSGRVSSSGPKSMAGGEFTKSGNTSCIIERFGSHSGGLPKMRSGPRISGSGPPINKVPQACNCYKCWLEQELKEEGSRPFDLGSTSIPLLWARLISLESRGGSAAQISDDLTVGRSQLGAQVCGCEDTWRPRGRPTNTARRHSLPALNEKSPTGTYYYVLVLTMHHASFDGFSGPILASELTRVYSALSKGSSLPKDLFIPGRQYKDYTRSQKELSCSPVAEAQLAYWNKALDGAPAVLDLPLDKPRSAKLYAHPAKSLEVPISADLIKSLRSIGKAAGVSTFCVLLAGLQALLSRWCGQDDVIVGTPVAGRDQECNRNLIGYFVNTVALRAKGLVGTLPFNELLQQTNCTLQEARSNAALPFQTVAAAFNRSQTEKRSGGTGASPVMLEKVDRSWLHPELSFPGLFSSDLEAPCPSHTKVELSLEVDEQRSTLRAEYSAALFEASTVM